jgi:hypothetical protein
MGYVCEHWSYARGLRLEQWPGSQVHCGMPTCPDKDLGPDCWWPQWWQQHTGANCSNYSQAPTGELQKVPEPGVVKHACNPSTWEVEAGGSLVWYQAGLYIKTPFQQPAPQRLHLGTVTWCGRQFVPLCLEHTPVDCGLRAETGTADEQAAHFIRKWLQKTNIIALQWNMIGSY